MRDRVRKTGGSKSHLGARFPREEGAVIKDWGGRIPVALIYPNSYYLGMSNLGIHAIYSLLNGYAGVVCERVFHEKENRDLLPVSIESRRPLTDFAVLAFSVSYELDYFNIVSILKSSGIPLLAVDRDERHPLIIAGGPCITANPMPLSPFFDGLCIGEAESLLPAMLPVIFEGIYEKRNELTKALASLPGVYVSACPPSTPIVRQWAKDLDAFATTSVVLTPDTELGDLFLIEVERGCQRGCRFCLVNTAFAPMRFRSLNKLIEQAEEGLRHRKRIGLVGPAVTDHPQIRELLVGLRRMGAGLSISSLRINSLSGDILDLLAEGNARTITVAPEAGSQRLRDVINKGISDSDILKAADSIAGYHFKHLKLYFMLGLPSETDEDVEDIIKLALAIKGSLDRHRSNTRITVNVASFVPKAGTPFQWLPMAPLETLNRRLSILKNALPPKGIRLKAESPAWSQIQGVLARGDASLAEALANMEEVSLSGWRRAVAKCQIDIDYYVNQAWDTSRWLPWAMIDSGTKTEKLCSELEKASAFIR
jgi:radical SAM superfamily enzyme YgiQ (UPF0313 family)